MTWVAWGVVDFDPGECWEGQDVELVVGDGGGAKFACPACVNEAVWISTAATRDRK